MASDSLSPGLLLDGGELLLTEGSMLTPETYCAYVEEVSAGGASILVLRIGKDMPFSAIPPDLISACNAADVTLASVASDVSSSTVVRAVYMALASEQRLALQASVDLFAVISAAVGRGEGVSGIVAAWKKQTGVPVLVADMLGRVLAGSANDLDIDPTLLPELALQSHKPRTPIRIPDADVTITALGSPKPRGLLIAGTSPMVPVDLAALTSFLGLELERLWLADEPSRQRRAEVVGAVLSARTEAAARSKLRSAGLADKLYHVVVVDPGGEDITQLVAEAALLFRGGMARIQGRYVEIIVGHEDPVLASLERLLHPLAAGVGAMVTPGHLAVSRTQALAAVHASAVAGRPITFNQGIIFDWLADTVDAVEALAFSDAILAPIEAGDPEGILLATLRTWMEENCSLQGTCERMNIHRHTLRARLRKIEAQLGQPLEALQTRTELWLAINIRPITRWPEV
ncbi:purine catabolism regulator [Paenarthrobacter nitroguajacolicus]|nr:purine catabolism regulator [Paenarthrobacter nitroguajacolicus]